MSRPTLYYWPLRARGEATRMILHYGDINFVDSIIPLSEFGTAKLEKPDLLPFGQLPTMVLPTGTVIAQSGAIVRYAAKLAGVYPDDPNECAQADMVFELAQDMNLISPIYNFFSADSPDFEKSYSTYFQSLPARLDAAEKILGSKKFFGGEQPHFGDFGLLHILDLTVTVKPDSLDSSKAMQSWLQNMKALPAIAKYLAERPKAPEIGCPGSLAQRS